MTVECTFGAGVKLPGRTSNTLWALINKREFSANLVNAFSPGSESNLSANSRCTMSTAHRHGGPSERRLINLKRNGEEIWYGRFETQTSKRRGIGTLSASPTNDSRLLCPPDSARNWVSCTIRDSTSTVDTCRTYGKSRIVNSPVPQPTSYTESEDRRSAASTILFNTP